MTATFGLSLALGGLACGENSSTEAPAVGFPGPSADGGFIGLGFSPNSLPGSNGGIAIPGVMPARLALFAAPTKPTPPISGGTLSVNADGSLVVAADTDRDAVHVLTAGATGLRSVALAPGSEPGRALIDDHRHAHVALRGTGALALIDLDAASLISTTPVCTQPRGLAYDAALQTLSVACASGKLVTVQAADHTFVSELLLDSDVRDIVGTESTGLKVSRYRSAELISLASDGRPLGRAFAKGAVRANFTPSLDSEGPVQLHFSAAVAWRTVQSAQGTSWMLHQQSQSDVVAESPGGYASGCSTVTSGAATEFDQSGNPTRVLPLTLGGLSVDLAVAPSGRWLAVASPGGYVQKVSTLQLLDTRNAAADVPDGLCGSPPTMVGADDAQVTAVAFDGAGVLYAFSREPASISSYRVDDTTNSLSLLARVPVGGSSLRDTGHDMFHADVGTGLSCAACHGEATDDGHVWNFSESGPRRTQNVRGGILASAPYHWSGDLADVQHLLDEVMTGRMGGFNVDAQFASALGTWLDAQPQQAVQAADPGAAARGKALFESASVACATCHGGPRFSNGKSEDVGTGGSFQVPSLLGVSLRPPYMHDGCAATLAARFEPSCGGGDKHGHTAKLSDAERADLIAYLASI